MKEIFKASLLKYFIVVLTLLCYRVAAAEVNILAVDEPPAAYVDYAQKQHGYVLDIVKALQKNLNDKAKILFIPEARALNIMAEEPDTLLMSISRTPSRERHFNWIAKVMEKKWEVYTLRNANISINTISDLRLLSSIGVVRGDVREEWLVNNNFKNLYSVTMHKQNVQMLKLGRVDAIIYEKQGLVYQSNSLGIEPLVFKSVFVLNQASVYIVMSKHSSPQLVKQWQSAFAELAESGELARITLHWQLILRTQFCINSDVVNNILVF